MEKRFKYFVLLAEMRTGSNFLEESLNQISGISCLGEAFNPFFVGHAGKDEMLGVSKSERDRNPKILLKKMTSGVDGISGFRFFHDHDPRILDICLADPECAKIVLTRNPLDTYVSREIVRQTGQWRLGDLKNAKSAKVEFDVERFGEHMSSHVNFQLLILNKLQTAGQTAFYLDYDDISSQEVISGLAKFLGVDADVPAPPKKTKKQNPEPLENRVSNFGEMEEALRSFDHFGLNRTPNFEPRRGPMVPNYVAAATLPLLFLPIPGTGEASIRSWLARTDQSKEEELLGHFTQKSLRQWKRRFKSHLSFTVISHPVERLFRTFCRKIATNNPFAFLEIRAELIKNYKIPIIETATELTDYSDDQLREAFCGFADFVKGNLNGQTNIRVDPAWASQSQILHGFSQFMSPDHVLRMGRIENGLKFIADEAGIPNPPEFERAQEIVAILNNVYDEKVEATVKAAYQRDYMMFGFGPWGRS